MTPAQIVTQIKNVIQKMIEVGLSNQQNYPVLTDTGPRANEIGIAGAPRLSVSMKKVPYRTIYEALDRSGAYHIRMIDGALLQMCYRFDKDTVIAHRLCMFPAPHLPNYELTLSPTIKTSCTPILWRKALSTYLFALISMRRMTDISMLIIPSLTSLWGNTLIVGYQ